MSRLLRTIFVLFTTSTTQRPPATPKPPAQSAPAAATPPENGSSAIVWLREIDVAKEAFRRNGW